MKNPLGFSGHGIIVPVNHFPTIRKYKETEEAGLSKIEESKLFLEIAQYKSSLVKMFKSLGDYDVVFWDISRAKGIHGHTQFLPILLQHSAHLQEAIDRQIEFAKQKYHNGMDYIKFTDKNDEKLSEIMNTSDYMSITLVKSETDQEIYVFKIEDEDAKIDMQFPRRVLAFLLKLTRRLHWTKCRETEDQESEQKVVFRDKFRPFDFTLQNNK
ncbi:unnamed protein product [Ambrosiozyma monospora]|uniref:Unnamed protein product n=1 Tax=Ambrosiozyma monospora TaxID=43982 RepID=A0ACB5TBW7_AMBMO|nr:unnamed protein product [Ambrosiozyma monospora]